MNRLFIRQLSGCTIQFALLRGDIYQPSVAYASNSHFVDFGLCSLLLSVSATLITIRYSTCSLSSRLAKCLKFYSSILTNYLDIYELTLNLSASATGLEPATYGVLLIWDINPSKCILLRVVVYLDATITS